MADINKLKNAVQPDAWYKALPRAGYTGLEKVMQSQSWFEVYRLPHDVYTIYEPGHFQEVISFLVIGKRRALLLDTGMGIGDMKKLVSELTPLDVTVVNSHTHFDHIGCNHQFDFVYVHPYPGAARRLENGLPHSENAVHLAGDSTCRPYPGHFDPGNYTIRPSKPAPLTEGQVFDLGGRQLQVLFTPGHSPDSIMLLDRQNSILFTGDTFYPATLYCHLSSEEGLDSSFEVYKETMLRLADEIDVRILYCSHNEPMVDGVALKKVAKAFCDIADKRAPYRSDESGLLKYDFEGFSIVTKSF